MKNILLLCNEIIALNELLENIPNDKKEEIVQKIPQEMQDELKILLRKVREGIEDNAML